MCRRPTVQLFASWDGGRDARHWFGRLRGRWGSLLVSGGPSLAEQDRTADAAMKVAQRKADCPGCDFDFTSRRPLESARAGSSRLEALR